MVKGGEALTPMGWRTVDVAVEKGHVTGVGTAVDGDETIDARGCFVGPSFVDLHTHLRYPGQSWKEDMESGGRAAAAGGFGAVVAMPNTDPPVDSPKVLDAVLEAATDANIDVLVASALTAGRSGTAPADVAEMYARGTRLFTDDGDAVEDPAVLAQVMGLLADLPGAVLAQHAEDSALTAGGQMNEGALSRSLGVGGLPTEAESSIVDRDLRLAAATGVHYHCQHVSAAATVALVRRAKANGLAVTAEVTPHHLTFDESHVAGLDPDFKMYPPLRSAADRKALVQALEDGTIDVVATDHAPHLPREKDVGFDQAPRGVIGLETAASAVWETLRDPNRMFEVLSLAPARILGLSQHGRSLEVGNVANLVIFDPMAQWQAGTFQSKSANSPYRGRPMLGRVKATLHRGRVIYQGGVR